MKTAEQWAKEMPAPLGEVFLMERERESSWKSDKLYNSISGAIDEEIRWSSTIDEDFWNKTYRYFQYNEPLPDSWLKKTLAYKRQLDSMLKKQQWSSTLPLAC